MPWFVKCAAYLLNRYSVHSDGNTSYYRPLEQRTQDTNLWGWWNSPVHVTNSKTQAQDGSTLLLGGVLGKDTPTNENILGISKQIVKARTFRRQTKPDKYHMMDIIDSTPMTTPTPPTSFVVLPAKHTGSSKQATVTAETQTQQAPELPVPRDSQHYIHTGDHRHAHGSVSYTSPKSTTTDPNSKTGGGRWHCWRQFSKTAEDNSAPDGTTTTGRNTRTRQDPTQSVGFDNYNKTWRKSQSSLQRRVYTEVSIQHTDSRTAQQNHHGSFNRRATQF